MPLAESPTTIELRVLLFSVLRDKVGREALAVRIPLPATGEDLLDLLAETHSSIADYRSVIRLAVNQTYVPETVPLTENDEIALITPVSGG